MLQRKFPIRFSEFHPNDSGKWLRSSDHGTPRPLLYNYVFSDFSGVYGLRRAEFAGVFFSGVLRWLMTAAKGAHPGPRTHHQQ